MIGTRDSRRLGGRCLAALALYAIAMGGAGPAFAQEVGGAYVLLGDSDGTKPRTGARLELRFSGGLAGSVKLFAVRPGETVHDTGTYSISGHLITIHFNEVDWAADRQPYSFDGCTLTLPFMAVSAATASGTSMWRREDEKCAGPQQGAAAQSHTPGPAPKPFTAFSADEVLTEGGRRQIIKVHATETSLRSETEEDGRASITIIRLDRGVMWVIDPQRKTYTETRINRGGGMQSMPGSVPPGCRVVGEEQVGGYHCQKQLCHVAELGQEYTETRWVPRELSGVVVRATDGTRTLELNQIHPGPQEPALFELPAGYRKSDQ